jgi:hypothetical protein
MCRSNELLPTPQVQITLENSKALWDCLCYHVCQVLRSRHKPRGPWLPPSSPLGDYQQIPISGLSTRRLCCTILMCPQRADRLRLRENQDWDTIPELLVYNILRKRKMIAMFFPESPFPPEMIWGRILRDMPQSFHVLDFLLLARSRLPRTEYNYSNLHWSHILESSQH